MSETNMMKRIAIFFLGVNEEEINELQRIRKPVVVTSLFLIAVNLVPVIGMLWFRWNPIWLVFVYWMEIAIIGVLTIFRMLISGLAGGAFSSVGFVFGVAFFLVHFSVFLAGAGVLTVIVIFAPVFNPAIEIWGFDYTGYDVDRIMSYIVRHFLPESFEDMFRGEMILFSLLGVNHLFSFLVHFIFRERFREGRIVEHIVYPYKRLILVQGILLAGLFIIMRYGGAAMPWFVLLVMVKIITDLRNHIRNKIVHE